MKLKLQRFGAAAFAAIMFLVAIAAAYYGLVVLTDAATKIFVQVIAAAASLLGLVLSFVLQRNRELEQARIKATQEHYVEILRKLAPYVRNPEVGDDFTTAHLLTWIVGSSEVVEWTARFMKTRDYESLDALLNAMRRDLRLSEGTDDLNASTASLFPVPVSKPPGGLNAPANQALPPVNS